MHSTGVIPSLHNGFLNVNFILESAFHFCYREFTFNPCNVDLALSSSSSTPFHRVQTSDSEKWNPAWQSLDTHEAATKRITTKTYKSIIIDIHTSV